MKIFVDFLPCEVYTDGSDCTNGGASSRWDTLYLCKEHVSEEDVIEYCEENNCYSQLERFVCVETRNLWGREYKNIKLVCEARQKVRGLVGGMSGGNLLYSCDSRWKEFTNCQYPLAIHDRYETVEQYEMLSR